MSKLLAWIRMIPALIKAVRELETAIPLPVSGRAKLELLLALMKAFYDAEESVRKEIAWSSIAGVITAAVGLVVQAFNKLGIFKKSSPASG